MAGEIGVDAAEVIAQGLNAVSGQAGRADLLMAERVLVANAAGTVNDDTTGLPGAGILLPADALPILVREWQARLNPDGVAPNEENREDKSTLSFGQFENGLYRIYGGVTPDFHGEMEAFMAS